MLWGPHSTARWQQPRQGQGRCISTWQPVPARSDGGISVPATRSRNLQPWMSPQDARHPKIKALIDPFLAKDNQISVKAICGACGIPMYNLPGLAKYRDSTGRSAICWNNVLKGCGWSKCRLKRTGGHVPRKELTDGFAKVVCDKLGKGVTYLIHNH
jgi:hypothetical protein